MSYDLKCDDCNKVLGTSGVANMTGQICGECAKAREEANALQASKATLADRIAALESDVVKVTTVMVGKGELQAKDVAVAIEAVPNEEPLEP